MAISKIEIPRILHHVWVGGAPLPPGARQYIGTWRRHHPGWEMRLWTDADLPPLRHRALYDGLAGPGALSDVLRYELLARFGGVYADVDVECLRPLDPLLAGVGAFAGRIAPRRVESGLQGIEIAVLGSTPGHPFFGQVLDHLPAWAEAFRPFTSSLGTGPQFLERQATLWGHKQEYRSEHGSAAGAAGAGPGLTLFPPERFYPAGWDARPAAGATPAGAFPASYAVHHWWGTWHTDAVEPVGPVATLLSERLYPRLRRFLATLPPEDRAAAEATLLAECRACAGDGNAFYRLAAARALADLPGAEAVALRERLSRDPNAAVAAAASSQTGVPSAGQHEGHGPGGGDTVPDSTRMLPE